MPGRRAGDPALPEDFLSRSATIAESLFQRLDWDTEFFGIEVARVVSGRLNEREVREILAASAGERIELLYFLCDSGDTASVRLAERHGFVLTGLRCELERSLQTNSDSTRASAVRSAVRLPDAEDREPLLAIARDAFVDSRFFADSRVPDERARALYAHWLDGCLAEPDGRVHVEGSVGDPAGFVVISGAGAPTAKIDLLATAAAARGGGVATRLLVDAIGRVRAAGSRTIEVVTQGRSIGALRLYQRCGFLPKKTGLWYHRWFDR